MAVKQTGRKTYKTMQGKAVDMDLLRKRNELEIVDLINFYKNKNKLNITKLGRGTAWMHVGNFSDLQSASNFIQNIEQRQNYKIGCIEEIAFNNKWINKKNINNRIKFCVNTGYSKYLRSLISN